MYAIYRQSHPPTGVEHCVYCNFMSATELNLVVTAVNQIHVYRLNPEFELVDDKDEDTSKQKLECLASYSIFGNVMTMKSVRLPGALRDALLLGFSDAKLSVVEYDPGMHDLQTTSLHYFEDNKLKYTPLPPSNSQQSTLQFSPSQQYSMPQSPSPSHPPTPYPAYQYPVTPNPNQQYPLASNNGQLYHTPCSPNAGTQMNSNQAPLYANLTPNQQNQQPMQLNLNLQQHIVEKLESLDRRLNKLDMIASGITTLTQKLSVMDGRVSSLESTVSSQQSQIIDIQASRAFDSQTCDEIKSKQVTIDKKLIEVTNSKSSVSMEHKQLVENTARMSEELIDLQSRSMRDNLLFFNFKECGTWEERASENCSQIVLDFCADKLEMAEAPTTIKIDRAHRLGRFDPDKTRPIVAKFNFYPDKIAVKQKATTMLKHSDFGVADQFPKPIQERRKKLIPLLIKAKNEGKRAVLSYDKLYINNVLVKAADTPEPETMAQS